MAVSMERLLVVAHGGDCTVEERLAFEAWMEEEAVFMAAQEVGTDTLANDIPF